MEKLFSIANIYCLRTRGIPWRKIKKLPSFYFFSICGVFFPSLLIYSMSLNPKELNYGISLLATFLLEIGFLASGKIYLKTLNNHIHEKLSDYLNKDIKNIGTAKRILLKKMFPKHNGDYTNLVKHIKESIATYEESQKKLGLKTISVEKLIIDPDSKARIYTLAMFLLTVISTYSLKFTEDSDALFQRVDFFLISSRHFSNFCLCYSPIITLEPSNRLCIHDSSTFSTNQWKFKKTRKIKIKTGTFL